MHFKTMIDQNYGKDLALTKVMRATMRAPKAKVVYTGTTWRVGTSDPRNTKICLCWASFLHSCRMAFSRVYREKIYTRAITRLEQATANYKVLMGRPQNLVTAGLKSYVTANKTLFESIKADRSLDAAIQRKTQELKGAENRVESIYVEKGWQKPHAMKAALQQEKDGLWSTITPKDLSSRTALSAELSKMRDDHKNFEEAHNKKKGEHETLSKDDKVKKAGTVTGRIANTFSPGKKAKETIVKLNRRDELKKQIDTEVHQIAKSRAAVSAKNKEHEKINALLPEAYKKMTEAEIHAYFAQRENAIAATQQQINDDIGHTLASAHAQKVQAEIAFLNDTKKKFGELNAYLFNALLPTTFTAECTATFGTDAPKALNLFNAAKINESQMIVVMQKLSILREVFGTLKLMGGNDTHNQNVIAQIMNPKVKVDEILKWVKTVNGQASI